MPSFGETVRLLKRMFVGRRTSAGEAEVARCYVVLDCPIGADLTTVKSAYRRAMRKTHPDLKGGAAGDAATERTTRIQHAYETLEKVLQPE